MTSRRGGGRGVGGRDDEYPPLRQQPGRIRPSYQPASPAPAGPSRPAPQADLPASSAQEALSLETETKIVIEEPSGVAVSGSMTPLSVAKCPPRPGLGTVGRKCAVRANHFLVQVADKDLHHYDVAINPEITVRSVNRQILSMLVKLYGESDLGRRIPVYDGRKSLYTAGALPFTSKIFVVKLIDSDDKGKIKKEREFKVTIKFVGRPNLYLLQEFLRGKQSDVPQDTIQVLDLVLRESPSVNYITVGRSFFSPSFGRFDLGGGLECWRGYYQSLRPTQMGLSLNIDISSTSFYKAVPVVGFVKECLQINDISTPLSESDCVKIKKDLRGLKVDTTHTPRRYKITGISSVPMNQLKFTNEKGTAISVVQYFWEKYNCTLRHDTLPCLQSGNDTRPIYLPMEVCKIVEGQRYMKKLNEQQVRSLLKSTCQSPATREQSILDMVDRNYNDDKYAKEFGIQVVNNLVSVDARVLPPPQLRYHDESGRDKVVNPEVGQWNMINKKMVNGGIVENWTCVNFSSLGEDDIREFCDDLVHMCNKIGMKFAVDPLINIRPDRSDRIDAALKNIHSQSTKAIARNKGRGKQLQMLIVVLPDVNGFYGKIKRICETELGIVSQCCSPKHVSRYKNIKKYLENAAQNINAKVGGRNNVLEDAINRNIPLVTDLPTIIFGADVTHPSPGEDASPSIAAVVASMDWPEVTKYRASVSAQEQRQEMIKDLFTETQNPHQGTTIYGGMIREHLIAFHRATNLKPQRIIFYRDGVGEGQFSHVLLNEMVAIRKACASLEEGYLPPVTFVVVQKRHHTRLFPVDPELTDRSRNILPGTVVDSQICHPTEFDFYLCSHSGIQGTSRPTYYRVLLDENNCSADALQILTYSLCYTYARCTRSVSVVPPAYYAHLAASRARCYIECESSDGGSAFRPLPKIMDNVKDDMFYI
ncbi:hypothetical protein J5N97_010622 [Dioscorea zingiberensis]|uniref:Uncharacterized protein n=1 Tax=Dioscorea zingiberensis TaxID=325984 RepID=A0A9D5HNT0_9LILI|nr:hypothetical protein J5N97_010622 [Dioscorea zingiberensis]